MIGLPIKAVVWMGSSRKDLLTFPEPVRDHVGFALFVAQQGGKHRDSKPLSGFGGAGVLEVVTDFRGDTFRAVYTVRYAGICFARVPEESEGRKRDASPGDRDSATKIARGGADGAGERAMSRRRYETGSVNVFRDLGLPNAEEHFVKAQLVFKIHALMKQRRLKQVEAAELFGIRQPDVSKMLHGEFRQFSVERLLRFLVALNQDVEIVVKPHRDSGMAAALHVS